MAIIYTKTERRYLRDGIAASFNPVGFSGSRFRFKFKIDGKIDTYDELEIELDGEDVKALRRSLGGLEENSS